MSSLLLPIISARRQFVVSAQWTSDGNSIGWGGLTLRQIIPATALISGSAIRLTLQSATTLGCAITSLHIQRQGAGDAYDFDSTPAQFTFSGSSSVSLTTNASVTTDALTFVVDSTKNYVVSAYITSGDVARITALSGWVAYYKSGDSASTIDVSGYLTSGFAANLVRKIEIVG
jgi:hypothetical protein